MSLSLYIEGLGPGVRASTLSWQFPRGAPHHVARSLDSVSHLMDASVTRELSDWPTAG